MKKILLTLVAVTTILLGLATQIEAYQTAPNAIQVTFKNGFNIVLDNGDVNTFTEETEETEVTTDGITINNDNWLEDDTDENSYLEGNVIIESDSNIIEISKETYDIIEHGENADLDGEIWIENEDVINGLDKEQQIQFEISQDHLLYIESLNK